MAIEKAAEENTVKKGFVIFVSSDRRFPFCNITGGADTQVNSPAAARHRATRAVAAPAWAGASSPAVLPPGHLPAWDVLLDGHTSSLMHAC